jgi:pilus assembly protein CpaF
LEDAPDAIADMCMLDGRGMSPARLTKRITEYVTQIGIEMGLVDGKRKLLRIGEYIYENGEVKVRDIVRFDFASRAWTYPQPFSSRAVKRMMKYGPEDCGVMEKMGLTERC